MSETQQEFLLYIHIPFCISKCSYCDFNSSVFDQSIEGDYLVAIQQELLSYAKQQPWAAKKIRSIYFGGGTPSIFKNDSLQSILETVFDNFSVKPDAEITLEANPGTLNSSKLANYHDLGIKRLSLGIQSFNGNNLKILNRSHTVDESLLSFSEARQAGFQNISIDLITALPNQDSSNLQEDLEAACALKPEHISIYTLTLEQGTPLYKTIMKDPSMAIESDQAAIFFEETISTLTKQGFEHYEISNFARPGFYSQHNLGYWSGFDYLGIGAGAHSYQVSYQDNLLKEAKRWMNDRNYTTYINKLLKGLLSIEWAEQLDQADSLFEFLFLGLRKTDGLLLEDLSERFPQNLLAPYDQIFMRLSKEELLEVTPKSIKLSPRGLLVADSVFVELAPVSVQGRL